MKEEIRKIGIGFITGRKSFRHVLATYLNSWGDKVLSVRGSVELNLFVAYDLEYNNTQVKDYTDINIELSEMLSSIHFINRASIQAEALVLHKEGVLSEREATLFFEKGYAGKRNAILYSAAKQGMDAIMFLDDDEYPLAVQRQNGAESWTGQEILSTHLASIDDAHITCGHHCGYISTIPNMIFDESFPELDFRIFIEAISNDIVNWEDLRTLMQTGGISYADSAVLSGPPTEVQQVGNTKFITGSNLCINLRDLSALNPFYNPPLARGEDTFLSTCLVDNTVLRVPCYTFHDGFSVYSSLLKGVLPQHLRPITAGSKKVNARFYSACLGWIRYKPLLLYITQRDGYEAALASMREGLARTLPLLCEYFDNPKFMKIADELEKYSQNVEKHYQDFETTKAVWQKIVVYLHKNRNR